MADDEDKKYMKKVNDALNYYTDDIPEEEIQKEIDNIIKYGVKDESNSSDEESSSSDEEYEKKKKKKKKKRRKKKRRKKMKI